MDRKKNIAGLIAGCGAAVALTLGLTGCSGSASQGVVHIGSKNFTEQVVLGEILAQHLEHRHIKVERSLNLGGTLLAHQALVNGQIDLYPEYTGTALAAVLKDPITTDPSAVLSRVRSEYQRRFQVEWLNPLGIDNGFAMVVRGSEQARAISDLKSKPWSLGVGYEFEQRADGLGALEKTYGLHFAERKTMDLGLLYKALEQGQVTLIAANATDGLLSKMDLRILTDDKHAFPPYEVCVEVRQEKLNQVPGLREALAELSGKFTNQKMQALNYEVDGEHRPVTQVAADFLKQAGLP